MRGLPFLAPFLLAAAVAAGDFVLLEGDVLDLDVGGFRTVGFSLQEYQADGAAIEGTLDVRPDTASVELLLMHRDDFERWMRGLSPVDTLASARTTGGPLRLELPRFGALVLVVSNRGNLSAVSVGCLLDVVWRGPEGPGDPLPSALKLLIAMTHAAVTIAVTAGLIVREASARKRRRGS